MLGAQQRLPGRGRMRHGHHHGTPHDLGEGGEHLVADRRAPVLADQQARIAAAEHPDQLADIHRQRADIEEARPRDLGGRVAAQPRCCHAEPSPGQGSQLVVPCMRRVRPAVQQHDQRPAAPLQVSEPQPVGRDPAFPQQTRHQPIISQRLRPGTQGTTRCSSGTPGAATGRSYRITTTAGTPSTSRDRLGQHPTAATSPQYLPPVRTHSATGKQTSLMWPADYVFLPIVPVVWLAAPRSSITSALPGYTIGLPSSVRSRQVFPGLGAKLRGQVCDTRHRDR